MNSPSPIQQAEPFQQRVNNWVVECFGEQIANDTTERNHRFLEEALELVQSLGCTRSEVMQLVDYVFARSAGEPAQEVGGVAVTLASLCAASSIDMQNVAEMELQRISDPTITSKIRAKHAAKPKYAPSLSTQDK